MPGGEIHILDADGSDHAIAAGEGNTSPMWALPDSIAYVHLAEGGEQLVLEDLKSGKSSVLALSVGAVMDWSVTK